MFGNLPTDERMERFDRLVSTELRKVAAASFIAEFGMDLIAQIVAEGRQVWRDFSFQVMRKYGLKQQDADWIFDQFVERVQAKRHYVHEFATGSSRPFVAVPGGLMDTMSKINEN